MNTPIVNPLATAKPQLPTLIKMSNTYKLNVPKKVEAKIRYLLHKFPSTEWSGVLFYTYNGSFEDGSLTIDCQDIYPMDLGNATYTDFFMSEDVTHYIADNLELFDCEIGLVHSHHNMPTFFSGTDVNTLREEGNERNCFVSLIVNNKGEYSAAITRKVHTKKEIATKILNGSYEFFGNGEKALDKIGKKYNQTIDYDEIQYFMLEVSREVVDNPFISLDERFDEIKAKKKPLPSFITGGTSYYPSKPISIFDKEEDTFDNYLYQKKNKVEEPTIWDKKTMESLEVSYDEIFDEYAPDSKLIHEAVVRLITCSFILDAERFDLQNWIDKHMKDCYKKWFINDFDEMYSPFEIWCDFMPEYLVTHFYDLAAPPLEKEDYEAIVATAMTQELLELKAPTAVAKYIDSYVQALEPFIESTSIGFKEDSKL